MKSDNEMCYNLALRKSCRLINHFYESRLLASGLNIGQFAIIRTVNYCKQTTNSELQKIMILDQTTLSRNLKPLIRDGLLQYKVDKNDKRIKNISLTKQGTALYKKALPLWQQAQKELMRKLGKSESQKILDFSQLVINELKETIT